MAPVQIGYTACPHDCPSTCALDVEIVAPNRIGKIRGAKENSYTAGVICAKVARYIERVYHPDRLLVPLVRNGKKGEGKWQEASWEAALDVVAERFQKATEKFGSTTIWPYFFAGTMGLVQRDSINRLRHAGRYSGQFFTFCTNTAATGYFAGTGRISGVDPREMEKSDLIVIWGTNAASTQVNVMTHATKARKQRHARIVAIDVFESATVRQADLGLILRPGTDAALACAVMHILFRDNFADWAYLEHYSDDPHGLERHLQTKTPQWAAEITGLSVDEIETFARWIGTTKRSFFRLGYGFTRQRNGAVAMHAALCVPTVSGAWQYEGGGVFYSNAAIFSLNKNEIEGLSYCDASIRSLDQSKIGRILLGDKRDLYDGPPVTVLFVQNTNPANVAPEQRQVKAGLLRDDLFTVVHEQFMTDTAKLADVVLPATMFLEHDDIYRGGGQQHIVLGPKLVEPPAGPKPNLYVINELAKRLGFAHLPGFDKSAVELIDSMLRVSRRGTYEELRKKRWLDVQPPFEQSHFLNGFAWPDGKFRFKAQWTGYQAPDTPPETMGHLGPYQAMPDFPDHWDVIEKADKNHPFRLVTSPAHNFLNSTFSETPTALLKEGKPQLMLHPDDAAEYGIRDGDIVEIGNDRGSVAFHAKIFVGLKRHVVVSQGLFANQSFLYGEGINVLTGADSPAPNGGLAVHDIKVWLKKLDNCTDNR
ncbi:molybdopterin oxidoreductase family protein [uncultured Bartonella sp.]|uniref:molybdopterin oxidoreductase family protein n=1 Tax=uncultured Bartonella sp. TaxID=104108 RepID=UPI00260A6A3D|nr:molybdopterin oxidoreductase family protein [uncultured Bartonella sp.]